ncbi:alpha/beta hydrolase [Tabrizicola sp. J26]|uniref:alpha/beta hydrolase n=1 Tax=Alitabrizicola rongguiensis TaxID=2909234 RepID=UPI001F1769A6|nr:alpha/beta hydrolase [Tabrizicola rongguiensis]MCF1710955.1 alpha/beta hydrolase [Tabrizicola rongguiensis]
MADIDELRALLHAKPRPVGWDERRARMDEVCTADGVPEGVSFSAVMAAGRPAEWSATLESRADRVVLYLHGGGYCSGSIASHRTVAGGIAKAARVRTLALGFRLAPEHPYPAALEDALGAWGWLRAQGIAAERICVAGDSAGGGLSLALMMTLRARGEALPGCAWLLSPWTDLTMSGESMSEEDAVDPLIHKAYLESLAEAYLAGHDPRDPLVSPLFGDMAGLPPTLIQVGSDETLLDDSLRLARKMGVAHVAVTLQVYPRMIHAFPVWQKRLAEGRRAIAQAAAFLEERLG